MRRIDLTTLLGAGLAVFVVAFVFRDVVRSLEAFIAVTGTIVLLAGAVWIGQRVFWSIKWVRPPKLLGEPYPSHWPEIVSNNFPLARRLTVQDFDRLLKLTQLFLHKKKMEGAGGLTLTDEIRVTIAAQACFLLLWLNVGLYPALRTVIVYPSTVVPKRAARRFVFGGVDYDSPPRPILGESWASGVVILSWDSAQHGALDPRDGKNVVFHEFAHQLDQEDGEADGIPVGLRLSALKPWAEAIERRFGELKKAKRKGKKTVMNTYGAKNRAEFFAVATETFFEKPLQLRAKRADLYGLLARFYGVDPAAGLHALNTTVPT